MSNWLRNLGMTMVAATMTVAGAGCAAEADDDEATESSDDELAALRPGVNSNGCRRSPYNCGLNPDGVGQRVRKADGQEDWAVSAKWVADKKLAGVPVVDGMGSALGFSKRTNFVLNYGQTRRIGNTTYVMALSTGLGSAGWVPIDSFLNEDSLRKRVGEVNARGQNLKELGCYEVKGSYDSKLDGLAVVKNATDKNRPEPDDYLPKKRANGKVYMNLAFSAPGDALGAPAVDIFPQGTKFQRLDVPTWESGGQPSLDVNLYAKQGAKYSRKVGEMKFVYGYVKAEGGSIRYGWMALDGLKQSEKCPND